MSQQTQAVTPLETYSREALLRLLHEGFTLERVTQELPTLDTPLMLRSLVSLRSTARTGFTDFEKHYITAAQLRVLDERMPDCLIHMLHTPHYAQAYPPRYPGARLTKMLAFWDKQYKVLPEAAFNGLLKDDATDNADQYVTSLTALGVNQAKTDASLTYTAFTTAITSSGIRFALQDSIETEKLNIAWLDDHVPQWRNRVDIAEGLSLTGAEAASYVFSGYWSLEPVHPDGAALSACMLGNLPTSWEQS